MPKRPPLRYDMKRPCDDCPFRRVGGIRLRRARAQEIIDAIIDEGKTFECHKTAHQERRKRIPHQHCAGALIYSEKHQPYQGVVFQIGTRLGVIDPSTLVDKAAVFDSDQEMLDAQDENTCLPVRKS